MKKIISLLLELVTTLDMTARISYREDKTNTDTDKNQLESDLWVSASNAIMISKNCRLNERRSYF